MSVWTIVVAAGSGARFGGLKQFEKLGSGRVVDWSIRTALRASDGVVVVLPASVRHGEAEAGFQFVDPTGEMPQWLVGGPSLVIDPCQLDENSMREIATLPLATRRWQPVLTIGGVTRTESVRNGLMVVPPAATTILVHDGARPFATEVLFKAAIAAVEAGADGVVPGVAVTDTIKQVDESGCIVATVDRSALRAVQTPQAFRASILRSAYAGGSDATDDASTVEAAGGRVIVIDGEEANRKITTPADLVWARQRVESK